MNFSLHVPPEQMTWRARIYLGIGATRHACIGLISFTAASTYDGSPWAALVSLISLTVWGALFVLGGLHFAYAALFGHAQHARWALVTSAVLTGMWAAGFLISGSNGSVTALLIGVLLGALSGKDLTMCAAPLRTPLEPFVRRMTQKKPGGR